MFSSLSPSSHHHCHIWHKEPLQELLVGCLEQENPPHSFRQGPGAQGGYARVAAVWSIQILSITLSHMLSHVNVMIALWTGPASGRVSHAVQSHTQKAPALGLMLCYCHLETLSNFFTKDPTFSFCTVPHRWCDTRELFYPPDSRAAKEEAELDEQNHVPWIQTCRSSLNVLKIMVKYTLHKLIILTVLKWAIQWHLVHLSYCATITTTQLQNIFITPERKLCLLSCHSPFFLPQSPAPTNLFSVSMELQILEVSHKWHHTI